MQQNLRPTGGEKPLAGRVAIVTGAGRGLGRAMAMGLVAAGAAVVATAARERHELESLAFGTGADMAGCLHVLVADVTREEDCARTVASAIDRFGRLDILVNNGGRGMKYVSEDFMTQPTRFWETPAYTWRLVINTNVVGPFLMARAAVPAMLERRWGRIVNISINTETMRRRGFSPYGPSKAAMESATNIWAQDLADTGITVNALLPGGAALTGMIPQIFPKHLRATLLDPEIIVRRFSGLPAPKPMGLRGGVSSLPNGAQTTLKARRLAGNFPIVRGHI